MSVRIIDKAAEKVVGVRVVGPYPQTIPQGSQQLLAWRQRHGVPFGKWLVLYWDDPAEVAPEKLRAELISIGLWVIGEADRVREERSTDVAQLLGINIIIRDALA